MFVCLNDEMINLLPAKYKKELWQEEKYKLILISGILVLIFFITFSLILFAIKTYLSGQLEFQKILLSQREKEFKKSEIQNLEEVIAFSDQVLPRLSSFYSGQLQLTDLFAKLSLILPSEIYLTSFSYQKESGQVALLGFSPTREILLEFKKNLESQEHFTEIYFPPQNWLESTDINFSVTFKMK